MSTRLPMLGFHLDGRPCRVGCSFCYLGARPAPGEATLDAGLLAGIVANVPAARVAVALSEPAERWRAAFEHVAVAARARGIDLAVTTTAEVIESAPWVLAQATSLNLSVDPGKGRVDVRRLAALVAQAAQRGVETVALVSLVDEVFCARLAGGLLRDLLDEAGFAIVALNGLKPPPPWCDRAFWLRFLARIRPLLDEHLGRRLHLDCYVNARILALGACPAKPDVSPGREFRSCVYQAEPDFVFADAADLARRTAGYLAPSSCPFPVI